MLTLERGLVRKQKERKLLTRRRGQRVVTSFHEVVIGIGLASCGVLATIE